MLWALTSYFNPTASKRRFANFHAFRRELEIPLLAVEWSRDGRFELDERDADLLVRVDGGDRMWQKERLLNIGIERLPATCGKVAWVDCDIVFDRPDWAAEATRRLDDTPLVQLYDSAVYLARSPIEQLRAEVDPRLLPAEFERSGFASRLASDSIGEFTVATEAFEAYRRMPSTGFAWAARRELVERHPFLDFWIVGGGDTAYTHAAAGKCEHVVRAHGLSASHRDAYLPRAHALAGEVAGRIGDVPGRLFHLWHGEIADRRYRSRHAVLAGHDYDPARCIRHAPSGAWRWADPPPGLAAAVRAYLDSRKDDDRTD